MSRLVDVDVGDVITEFLGGGVSLFLLRRKSPRGGFFFGRFGRFVEHTQSVIKHPGKAIHDAFAHVGSDGHVCQFGLDHAKGADGDLELDSVVGVFHGLAWALPSRVYARALELYPNLALTREQLVYELDLSSYLQVQREPLPGQYRLLGESLELHSRRFDFGDQLQDSRLIQVFFEREQISALTDSSNLSDVFANTSFDFLFFPK